MFLGATAIPLLCLLSLNTGCAFEVVHEVNAPYLRNGSAVPGSSPVRYAEDPVDDLFAIDYLNMYPNPCVM